MKLNKKQSKALDILLYDIDELNNKPRRFFDSLSSIVNVFLPEKDFEDNRHKNEVLDCIDEWEDMYYKNWNLPHILQDLYIACKESKQELLSRNAVYPFERGDDFNDGYEAGIKKASQLIANKISEKITEDYF